MTRLQIAILSFGIVNASLYSALLPLWEGFDEPAHYGYVESLWQTHRLPVLGRTTFPTDVIASFRFAPGSYLMHRWLPETTPYEEWFASRGTDLRMVADALEFVSRLEVPDLPDRIVAATAVSLRAPLISRDGKIPASQVQTIW